MLKHLIALGFISVFFVLSIPWCAKGIHYLLLWHQAILDGLNATLVPGKTAEWLKNLIALLIFPLGVGLCAYGTYFAIRRQKMPYLFEAIWVVWFILAAAIAATTIIPT